MLENIYNLCKVRENGIDDLLQVSTKILGTGPGTRTPNQLIKSQLLYQLS